MRPRNGCGRQDSMNLYLASIPMLFVLASTPAVAQSVEETNGCFGTSVDPCMRTGTCSIQGATWWQEASVARSDIFDTQGWPGLCDMVHVALVQGECFPAGQLDVTANLSILSTAWTPSIQGPLECASAIESACDDGVDNDRDGFADWPDDSGCDTSTDFSERPECDDGVDSDGDGWIDAAEDPGCLDATSLREAPACQDGLDNDGDGLVDFDGGASAGLDPTTDPDPICTEAWIPRERKKSCGLLGLEFLVVFPIARMLRRRSRQHTGGVAAASHRLY